MGKIKNEKVAFKPFPAALSGIRKHTLYKFVHTPANDRLQQLRLQLIQQQFAANGKAMSNRAIATVDATTTSVEPTRTCAPTIALLTIATKKPKAQQHGELTKTLQKLKKVFDEDLANSTDVTKGKEQKRIAHDIECYDQVHDNLVRRCAGWNALQKWRNDLYYCVLDTNILLDHLPMVQYLCNQHFHDNKGSILYVPYVVLQELDKLKMNENVRILTRRAIKYLNAQFDAKNEILQAQSALKAQENLIEIQSPDDRIINCCLQLKQHVSKVLLLSEDNNLRNKAAANDIATFNKSQLVANRNMLTTTGSSC